jgi:TonB family protein
MGRFNKFGLLSMPAIFLLVAMAQHGKTHPPRLICDPPSSKIVRMVEPTFPPEAKARNIFSTVVVQVDVDKAGKPSSVKVVKGDPVITSAVVEAVKKWRWKPLKLNGVAIEVETTISVTFEPH